VEPGTAGHNLLALGCFEHFLENPMPLPAAPPPSMPSAPGRQRLPGEVAFTFVLVGLSLFLLWTAYGISGFESITSAGSFPMFAAAVMLVCALLAMGQTLRAGLAPALADESKPQQFIRQVLPWVWVGFTVTLAVYMALLNVLGFLIASYLFLNVSMLLLGSRRIGLNLLVSALSLAAIYLIFQLAFSVVLPRGTWLAGWLP
jgi:putative tricarboxylic transport membrane protein